MKSSLGHLCHPRYWSSKALLQDFRVLKVSGPDSESFLNSQLTTNIKALSPYGFHMSTRLDRTGHVIGWFFVLKRSDEEHFIVVLDSIADLLQEDLEKYIIMEDVEIKQTNEKVMYFSCEPGLGCEEDEIFEGELFEGRAFLKCLEYSDIPSFESKLDSHTQLSEDDIKNLFALHAIPFEMPKNVTSSMLVEYCVDLKKGCFLGQENVAKIMNNRGAPYFPVILKPVTKNSEFLLETGEITIEGKKAGRIISVIKWNQEQYYLTQIFREFRVNSRVWDVNQGDVTINLAVHYLPFFGPVDNKIIANELYELGVEEFHLEHTDNAKNLLRRSIEFDRSFADSYETLGVICGNEGAHQEAIDLMDQLLEVDPDSVMAHTNKSLYFMKMGKIEEAEDEKSLATLASFKMFGKEAQSKKSETERQEKEEAELKEREEMFREVLEIDEDDLIANYGLADISFKRKNYRDAIEFSQKVLHIDPSYSVAYLLLGKSFLADDQKEKAKETFEKGISIASSKGDLMPANEMQSRLSQI